MRSEESRRCVLAAGMLWQWRSNDRKTMADIKTVGVIGGGTMGNGIAHVAARSGFKVIVLDVEQRFIDRAISTITKNLDREVAKNKITTDEKNASIQRIAGTTSAAAMAEADFIVEA